METTVPKSSILTNTFRENTLWKNQNMKADVYVPWSVLVHRHRQSGNLNVLLTVSLLLFLSLTSRVGSRDAYISKKNADSRIWSLDEGVFEKQKGIRSIGVTFENLPEKQ